jgi:hypothetical protein
MCLRLGDGIGSRSDEDEANRPRQNQIGSRFATENQERYSVIANSKIDKLAAVERDGCHCDVQKFAARLV